MDSFTPDGIGPIASHTIRFLRLKDVEVEDASAVKALGDPEGKSEAVVACLALGIPHNKAAGGAESEEGDGQVPPLVGLVPGAPFCCGVHKGQVHKSSLPLHFLLWALIVCTVNIICFVLVTVLLICQIIHNLFEGSVGGQLVLQHLVATNCSGPETKKNISNRFVDINSEIQEI